MTAIYFCPECYLQGYCRALKSRVVTDAELTPAFIRSVRGQMRAMRITPDGWSRFIDESYRDYPGLIVDAEDREVHLDTGFLNNPNVRYWFRDLCREVPEETLPRIRREARAAFKIVASILRATYPVPAMLWGRQAANDGGAAFMPVRPAGCTNRNLVCPCAIARDG